MYPFVIKRLLPVVCLIFSLSLAACARGATPSAAESAASASSAAPTLDEENVARGVILGEMAGHLYSSYQLWPAQDYLIAAVHTGHALGESLPRIANDLSPEDGAALREALTAYQSIAGAAGEAAAAQKAYDAAVAAIDAARTALVGADAADPAFQAAVLRELLNGIEHEYEEAVLDGQIVEVYEYQDAFGFLAVARQQYAVIESATKESQAEAADEIEEAFAVLAAAFAAVTPPEQAAAVPEIEAAIGEIRHELAEVFGLEEGPELSSAELIQQVRDSVARALQQYANGETDAAHESAISAYLDSFEYLEADLLAQDRELVVLMEVQFKDLRDQIQAGAALAELESIAAALEENLVKAEALLE